MKIIDCQQRTAQWFAARLGLPTASRFGDVLARLKSGEPAAAARDYALALALERVTQQMQQQFVNAAMVRGAELEDEARAAYETRTGNLVNQVGFCMHDTVAAGCSPDGLVGAEGILEIKCPENQLKIAALWLTGNASEYLPQIQGQLWITGRQWCDLVVYDPRLRSGQMEVLVLRIKRDEAYIAALAAAVDEFCKTVDQQEADLRASARAAVRS